MTNTFKVPGLEGEWEYESGPIPRTDGRTLAFIKQVKPFDPSTLVPGVYRLHFSDITETRLAIVWRDVYIQSNIQGKYIPNDKNDLLHIPWTLVAKAELIEAA